MTAFPRGFLLLPPLSSSPLRFGVLGSGAGELLMG